MLLIGVLAALTSATVVPPVPPLTQPPVAGAPVGPGAIAEDAQTLAATRDASERMTVDVFINGEGPYPFAIDTGADRTAIARSLSDRLALPGGGTAIMHSMGGAGTIDTAMISSLQVGRNEVRNVRAPVLADQNLGVPGLLGIDGLANQRIEMDFVGGEMKIFPSRRVSWAREEPGTITVTARRKYGQLILVDADVDGQKIDVILDSGSQVSVGNAALRRKLERRGTLVPPRPTELLDVAGNVVQAEIGTIRRMRVGGLHVDGLAIAWAEVHPFRIFGLTRKPAMLLGMDLLRTFERVSVDFGNKKVRFLLRESGRRGFASDDGEADGDPPRNVTG